MADIGVLILMFFVVVSSCGAPWLWMATRRPRDRNTPGNRRHSPRLRRLSVTQSSQPPNSSNRFHVSNTVWPIRKVRHNAKVGADIAVQLAAISNLRPPSTPAPPGSRTDGAFSGKRRPRLSPPPRVAVFGGAVADIVSKPPPGNPLAPGTSTPGVTRQSFGGVGRNVAEGIARAFPTRRGGSATSDESPTGSATHGSGADGVSGVDVTLVSVVGADDAGKALVAGCEEAGVRAEATVKVGGGRDQAGTASYVAMLDGEIEVVIISRFVGVVVTITFEVVPNLHPVLACLFWCCSERGWRLGGGGRGHEGIRGHDAGRSQAS